MFYSGFLLVNFGSGWYIFVIFIFFRQDFNDFGVAEFAAAYSNNFPAYPNPCHFALAAAANAHHVHHHVHHGAVPNAGTPTSQTSTGKWTWPHFLNIRSKGQLNSEWIYEVIVSPKMQT